MLIVLGAQQSQPHHQVRRVHLLLTWCLRACAAGVRCGRLRLGSPVELLHPVGEFASLVAVAVVQGCYGELPGEGDRVVDQSRLLESVQLTSTQHEGMTPEPSIMQALGQDPVELGRAAGILGALALSIPQERCDIRGIEGTQQNAFGLFLPIRGRRRHPGQRGSGAKDLGSLTRPEPGNDIRQVAEVVVDLFAAPQIEIELGMIILERG